MCLAVKQDFDLMVKGGPQCRLLRHPESFRATMVQVAEEAQAAFLKAHGSMQQLALQMGSVPGHLKQTATCQMTFVLVCSAWLKINLPSEKARTSQLCIKRSGFPTHVLKWIVGKL